jgi:hypothetical protein
MVLYDAYDIMIWVLSHDCISLENITNIFKYAARTNKLKFIKYLCSIGYEWTNEYLEIAKEFKCIDVIEWSADPINITNIV